MPRGSAPPESADAAEAYDRYAHLYDGILVENRINSYMRREMSGLLFAAYPPRSRLVELGCGTGDEAIALGVRGRDVLALDPSPRMIEIARGKAQSRSPRPSVDFWIGHARDAGRLLAGEATASFDGVYSSFALSYEPDLDAVRRTCARIVRPGGIVLVSAMNRICATEWLLSFASGRPSLAGRRLRKVTRHKVGTMTAPIYGRTARELARAFAPEFELTRLRALPAVVPPYYVNRPLRRFPMVLDALERLDPRVAGLPVMRALGDHVVAWMRRAT